MENTGFTFESRIFYFIKLLHAQILEKMPEGEMDVHLDYEKNSAAGNNIDNSRIAEENPDRTWGVCHLPISKGMSVSDI